MKTKKSEKTLNTRTPPCASLGGGINSYSKELLG